MLRRCSGEIGNKPKPLLSRVMRLVASMFQYQKRCSRGVDRYEMNSAASFFVQEFVLPTYTS